MKKLVVTRADENIREITEITHPHIVKYAENCSADFKVLEKMSACPTGNGRWHFKILELNGFLEQYDRVLHIDSDILVNKKAPNIFNEVPFEKIGTIFEDKGSRKEARLKRIKQVQEEWGDINWKNGYINTGMFLASKPHKEIFKTEKEKYWLGKGSDDIHLGYRIKKYGFDIHELNFKWNHMTMFSEDWNNNADRFESYFIHYAGKGIFEEKLESRIEQMKRDRDFIYGII